VKGHLELYHAFVREPAGRGEVMRPTEDVSSSQQESDPDWEIVETESSQSNVESAAQVLVEFLLFVFSSVPCYQAACVLSVRPLIQLHTSILWTLIDQFS